VLKQPAASCGRCVNKHINLALASADHGSEQTLAIGNPLSDFIRSQRSNLKEMKEEEFLARYDEYVKAKGGDAHHDGRSEPIG
jgi:hypothetical protein